MEDSEAVCAILHCARTGATPDGRPINEQPEIFIDLLGMAETAARAQERLIPRAFIETCKALTTVTAGMKAMGGGR